jgi:hypothetical protein
MSDIIPFPAPADTEARMRRVEEVRREREEQARLDASRLEDRRMLLERARKARAERKKMSALTERRSVARNLWEILDRLEKIPNPIRKVDVLIAAGKAQEGDSTKHLERYALRPGLPEVEEAKRSKRLVQAVRVYVEIARKAAELAGSDPDTAELEVLQGSRYLSDLPPERPDDPDARAADVIAEALRRMTDRLSQSFNLPQYFENCERHRLIPAETASEIKARFRPMYERSRLIPKETSDTEFFFTAAETVSLKAVTLPHEIKIPSGLNSDFLSLGWSLVGALKRCPCVYLGSVLAGKQFKAKAHGDIFQYYSDLEPVGAAPKPPRAPSVEDYAAALKNMSGDRQATLLRGQLDPEFANTPEYQEAKQEFREALTAQQKPPSKPVPAPVEPAPIVPLSGHAELPVKCLLTWDLELILAPFGPAGTVIPVIVRRAMTRIKPAELVLLACPDAEAPIYFDPDITLGECPGHLAPGVSSWRLQADERVNIESPYHGHSGDNKAHDYVRNLCVSEVDTPHQKNQLDLQTASSEALAALAKLPPFFRYFEDQELRYPFIASFWTDERQNGEPHFVPDVFATQTSAPTVATEGTILARLERWMRGDLEDQYSFDFATLEGELAHQVEKLVSACEAALTEAQRRLDLLLHNDEPES